MLKPLLVATVTLFLTACSLLTQLHSNPEQQTQNTVNRNYFIGDWACEMDGVKIGSSNKVKLEQDGYATYNGLLTMPKNAPLLQYRLERVGTWDFADNTLSYRFTKSNVTRAHSYEMLKKIKTDKELNAHENETFAGLTSQMTKANSNTVYLNVSNITPEAFTISQKLGTEKREGSCKRF